MPVRHRVCLLSPPSRRPPARCKRHRVARIRRHPSRSARRRAPGIPTPGPRRSSTARRTIRSRSPCTADCRFSRTRAIASPATSGAA
jgi:hypothetical protein